jgi:hypothetical protein
MPSTTKPARAATLDDLHQPSPPTIDIDKHKAEMAAIRAAQDARLEESLRLCSSKYAAEVERKKPQFQYKVEFQLLERKTPSAVMSNRYVDDGPDDDGVFTTQKIVKTVIAQDERTAWGLACDKAGVWPSPRLAKPKFTRLKKVDV